MIRREIANADGLTIWPEILQDIVYMSMRS